MHGVKRPFVNLEVEKKLCNTLQFFTVAVFFRSFITSWAIGRSTGTARGAKGDGASERHMS